MSLRPDLITHLKWGAPLAASQAAVAYVAVHAGIGWAIALGSIALGIGVELYQRARREGTPAWDDAAASAAPGVVLGLLIEIAHLT